jgi:folate-dependent phosphoribosylglycinamide formyltransferase PurN
MPKPKLIIFASGSKTGGGSGFENLVNAVHAGVLDADIVAVVSNHEEGGVRERATRLGIPFIHFPAPYNGDDIAGRYQKIVADTSAEFVALSGWLKMVTGLDPKTTFNIHPGPLPQFGGDGMYGHHVHEAVMQAYASGTTTHSAVSMHFVTEGYDRGPVFFQKEVAIAPDDTAETLAKKVNVVEHEWQSIVTNDVLHGRISWDGSDPLSLVTPYEV